MFLNRLHSENRALTLAISASLLFHVALLSIHFSLPQKLGRATEHALDVILVNSRSAQKPENAQARGQVNLDGGGNVDDERRAKSFSPPALDKREGDSLVEARRRVAELEQMQRDALAKLSSQKLIRIARNANDNGANLKDGGNDLDESTQAAMNLEAEINQRVEEYNKRPRKRFIGARTSEYRFAQYIEEWRRKVELIGNQYYPDAARGKIYGDLVVTVTIKSDGSIKEIMIDRPSGHTVLDDAVRRTVRLAGPFAAFPENIRRDTDEMVITRMWKFIPGDKLDTESAEKASPN